MNRFVAVFLGMITGLAAAIVAAFVHADRVKVFGTMIPYGLVMALALVLLSLIWVNRICQTRFAGIGFVLSWVLVTLRLAIETAGGDLVFMVAWYSTAYILAGAISLAMAATLPVLKRKSGPSHESSARQDLPQTID
jgi:hypothetical protein